MKTTKKILIGAIILGGLPLFQANATIRILSKPITYNKNLDSLHLYNSLENNTSYSVLLATASSGQAANTSGSNTDNSTNSIVDSNANISADGAALENIGVEPVADPESQLEDLIERQNNSITVAEENIKIATSTGSIGRRRTLGNLRFELVQLEGEQEMFNYLKDKVTDPNQKIDIGNRIQTLSAEKSKVQDAISASENSLTFLDWFTTLI